MMKEIVFKGRTGILMENGVLRVIVLPELGGKVASIYHKEKGFEFLFQNKEDVYRKPSLYADFAQYDASGFDDCFPTIDSSIVKYKDQDVTYPDHGEIWSAEFNYFMNGQALFLSYTSKILPYTYQKDISLGDDTLHLNYAITNFGDEPIKCIWALHCLLNCYEDMEIIFPPSTTEVVNVSSGLLGAEGTIHPFPVTRTVDGRSYRLDRVWPANSGICCKYYLSHRIENGICGVYYPASDLRLNIRYDPEVLPYLGFWVTAGGYRGDYNCALEPCNGFYDSIDKAERERKLYSLEPGTTLKFSVKLTVS
ncbi:DUF5107 domain-containing protein [Capillibacterium thermochitinicola]|uniref:DUF5107 domain-containing protein n=1 Tax=Capillibacterium thermochitinicola TaxID=2699427 RepID=A0A8J6HYR3_9FIRM|nr:DUF5107 domain-containing protein [Capillibacterium thermochitinicola]MBA2132505.1 DUF5107 domain-containing protein [Capillibacterium thermochitinicola]